MALAIEQVNQTLTAPIIVQDNAHVQCRFNVMNDRSVEENFYVKEYRVWNRYGEAIFDRDYISSMEKSPDHLVMLTALAHTQKLLYVILSQEFGLKYSDGSEKEGFKFWPTRVEVDLPSMVRQNKDVVQKLWVKRLELVRPGTYEVELYTTYNDKVTIRSDGKIYLI